jgi:hypothetical protein
LAQIVCPLGDLKQMLSAGWQIDLPVVRKQLPERPDGDWYVDVILWRDGRVKLLTLRDDPVIDQIVVEQGAECP